MNVILVKVAKTARPPQLRPVDKSILGLGVAATLLHALRLVETKVKGRPLLLQPTYSTRLARFSRHIDSYTLVVTF